MTRRGLVLFLLCIASFLLLGNRLALAQQSEIPVICDEAQEPLMISYGSHTEGCGIGASPTDTDRFKFNGEAGDSVRIVVLSNSGLDPVIELRDSSGVLIDSTSCGGACSAVLEVVLPIDGMYQFAIYDGGFNESGSYVLQLEKFVSPPQFTTLLYNQPNSEQINPATDHDFFKFQGVANDLVRLIILSNSGYDPYVRVRDSNGDEIATDNCSGACSFAIDIVLPQTGTYTVSVVDGGYNEAGNYQISLQCLFGACPQDTTIRKYFDITVVSDLNGNGSVDVASLSTRNDETVVIIYDGDTAEFITSMVFFFNKDWQPVAIDTLSDLSGNGISEISVLAVNTIDGRIHVKTLDPVTKSEINRQAFFFSDGWKAKGLSSRPDQNGNSTVELVVLAVHDADQKVRAQVKDSITNELLENIFYPY